MKKTTVPVLLEPETPGSGSSDRAAGCAGEPEGGEPPMQTLRSKIQQMEKENALLRREAARANDQLAQVQGHLTSLLSSRTFRYTQASRRLWRRLRGR